MVVVIISIVVNLACPAPKVILCGSKRGTSGWKIWVHYHPVGCVEQCPDDLCYLYNSTSSIYQQAFIIHSVLQQDLLLQCTVSCHALITITITTTINISSCISHQLILMIKTGPLSDEKSRDVQMTSSSSSLQGCVPRLRRIIMIFNPFYFFWWHLSIWAWCLVWLFWSLEQLKRPGTDESLSDGAPTPRSKNDLTMISRFNNQKQSKRRQSPPNWYSLAVSLKQGSGRFIGINWPLFHYFTLRGDNVP